MSSDHLTYRPPRLWIDEHGASVMVSIESDTDHWQLQVTHDVGDKTAYLQARRERKATPSKRKYTHAVIEMYLSVDQAAALVKLLSMLPTPADQ